jgi:GxxExxY protein
MGHDGAMDLIEEHNRKWSFFSQIAGLAMTVYNHYHFGLFESAYEAALCYLLKENGFKVERQVNVPIYWEDVQLDEHYRIDLLVNDSIILELKSISYVGPEQRKQLWAYMNLTHKPYGMLINFAPDRLYSEWYYRKNDKVMEKIKLL